MDDKPDHVVTPFVPTAEKKSMHRDAKDSRGLQLDFDKFSSVEKCLEIHEQLSNSINRIPSTAIMH
jgi:hypothetical protein